MTNKVPPYFLRTIKISHALVCRSEDLLSKSGLQTIQALLIFSMSLEMERGAAGTKVWNSLGLAIRSAQNLGLHRESDSTAEQQQDLQHIELKRRVWAGCLIADRWISALVR